MSQIDADQDIEKRLREFFEAGGERYIYIRFRNAVFNLQIFRIHLPSVVVCDICG